MVTSFTSSINEGSFSPVVNDDDMPVSFLVNTGSTVSTGGNSSGGSSSSSSGGSDSSGSTGDSSGDTSNDSDTVKNNLQVTVSTITNESIAEEEKNFYLTPVISTDYYGSSVNTGSDELKSHLDVNSGNRTYCSCLSGKNYGGDPNAAVYDKQYMCVVNIKLVNEVVGKVEQQLYTAQHVIAPVIKDPEDALRYDIVWDKKSSSYYFEQYGAWAQSPGGTDMNGGGGVNHVLGSASINDKKIIPAYASGYVKDSYGLSGILSFPNEKFNSFALGFSSSTIIPVILIPPNVTQISITGVNGFTDIISKTTNKLSKLSNIFEDILSIELSYVTVALFMKINNSQEAYVPIECVCKKTLPSTSDLGAQYLVNLFNKIYVLRDDLELNPKMYGITQVLYVDNLYLKSYIKFENKVKTSYVDDKIIKFKDSKYTLAKVNEKFKDLFNASYNLNCLLTKNNSKISNLSSSKTLLQTVNGKDQLSSKFLDFVENTIIDYAIWTDSESTYYSIPSGLNIESEKLYTISNNLLSDSTSGTFSDVLTYDSRSNSIILDLKQYNKISKTTKIEFLDKSRSTTNGATSFKTVNIGSIAYHPYTSL